MEPEFSPDELRAEMRRLTILLRICESRGELDGATAARSQLRALEAENAERG